MPTGSKIPKEFSLNSMTEVFENIIDKYVPNTKEVKLNLPNNLGGSNKVNLPKLQKTKELPKIKLPKLQGEST